MKPLCEYPMRFTAGVVLELKTPDLKAFKVGGNNYNANLFPECIIYKNHMVYGKDLCYIEYHNLKTNLSHGLYVPGGFEIQLVDRPDITAEYKKFQLKNLRENLYHSFSIGSDPEIFVEDKDGKVIPAFNFLGSKEKPNPTGNGTSMYWDGFQAEFNTHARGCLQEHTDSVSQGIKGVYDLAKKHNKKSKMSIKTTMEIDYDLLQTSAEEHVAFGCMPSYNIYGMKGIESNGRQVPFRSAGGHIHFGLTSGYGKQTHENVTNIVRALDAVLGVACVSMFAKYDDPRRRSMYGLAGEYRLPPHGLEYRVLSNAWLSHPAIMNLVFDTARKVVMFGKNGFLDQWVHDEKETIRIINTCDVDAARASLERNKDLFIRIIDAAYGNTTYATVAYNAFYNGMESIVADPTDIESNWDLKPKEWTRPRNKNGREWRSAVQLINEGKKLA